MTGERVGARVNGAFLGLVVVSAEIGNRSRSLTRRRNKYKLLLVTGRDKATLFLVE
jgi:hypothetical protein